MRRFPPSQIAWQLAAAAMGFLLVHAAAVLQPAELHLPADDDGPLAAPSKAYAQPPMLAEEVRVITSRTQLPRESLVPTEAAIGSPARTQSGKLPAASWLLHGRLRSTAGRPLPNAYAVATNGAVRIESPPTGQSGTYALAALAPGPWTIQLLCRGYAPVTCQIDLTENERRDFVLDTLRRIEVSVAIPSGTDIDRSQLVCVAYASPLPATFNGITGSLHNAVGAGSFRHCGVVPKDTLGAPALGTLTIHDANADEAWLVHGRDILARAKIESGVDSLQFTVERADLWARQIQVRCRVRDAEDGMPTACTAWICSAPFAKGTPVPAGSDGVLQLEHAHGGQLWLSIESEQHAALHLALNLDSGSFQDLGEVMLKRRSPASVTESSSNNFESIRSLLGSDIDGLPTFRSSALNQEK